MRAFVITSFTNLIAGAVSSTVTRSFSASSPAFQPPLAKVSTAPSRAL